MRMQRRAGRFPYVYTEAEKARKKASYELRRIGTGTEPIESTVTRLDQTSQASIGERA